MLLFMLNIVGLLTKINWTSRPAKYVKLQRKHLEGRRNSAKYAVYFFSLLKYDHKFEDWSVFCLKINYPFTMYKGQGYRPSKGAPVSAKLHAFHLF
jgi:hypothetical protein